MIHDVDPAAGEVYVDGHAWEIVEPFAKATKYLFEVVDIRVPFLSQELLNLDMDVTIPLSAVAFLGWLLAQGIDIVPELRINASPTTIELWTGESTIERV